MSTSPFSFNFNNRFVEQLPADSEQKNYPRQVFEACYSRVTPTKVSSPKLVCAAEDVAASLGIPSDLLQSELFPQVFSGNQILDGMQPYAMCYGGHQFGHWAGQLGDGRAINLAEVVDLHGQNQTLQLKGAGMTPYSRTADGLAVLRSSVREFLCSEAMFHLGVPTTRALSLTLTGEQVMRDMFYDGHAKLEPGAIVCRVAPSFLRFGSFQLFTARKDIANLKQLMAFTIRHDFPHLLDQEEQFTPEVYERWFAEVCRTTAELMVHWMRVGFVHGVMNTDNLSILGLTIDYGPYGWLENYDPGWTPNTTDARGKRYCYQNQPQIAQWNLFQLANAIAPVIGQVEGLEKSLRDYADKYSNMEHQMYAQKLGLLNQNDEQDQPLITSLLDILKRCEIDMTIFFRQLATVEKMQTYDKKSFLTLFADTFYDSQDDNVATAREDELLKWLLKYQCRLQQQKLSDADRKIQMNRTNPKFVLRNYLSQVAIEKAEAGDYTEIKTLLSILKFPYDEQPEFEHYAQKRPEWARSKPGCSMLSCSS